MLNPTFKLVPVLEINDYDFATETYPFPNGSRMKYPQEWQARWKKGLAHTPMSHLEQVVLGVPMVDITTLDNNSLAPLIKHHLEDWQEEELDNLLPLSGGLLVQQEHTSIIPQCCSSLEDFDNWNQVLEEQPKDWTQLWIGHPWLFARVQQGQLELSGYVEANEWEGSPIGQLSMVDFQQQWEQVTSSLKKFRDLVKRVLEELGYPQTTVLAKLLVPPL